ncbi:MAG: hypothetical protein U5K31_05435 [Balneolaceae bacterium]|nr:hypothetical protein [Balneolaceae bacterium]
MNLSYTGIYLLDLLEQLAVPIQVFVLHVSAPVGNVVTLGWHGTTRVFPVHGKIFLEPPEHLFFVPMLLPAGGPQGFLSWLRGEKPMEARSSSDCSPASRIWPTVASGVMFV